MDWHYNSGKGPVGPVEKQRVQDLLEEGTLSEATLVWNESFGTDWRAIGDIPDFRKSDAPPPLPLAAVNDFWVWLIAFVPLLGAAIEHVAKSNGADTKGAIAGYVVANTLFSYLDEKSIRNSGRKIPVSWGLGFLFAPAYLFIRARRLGKSQITFGVWIVAVIGALYVPQAIGNVYLGIGLPECDSSASTTQIKDIFPNIPINVARLTVNELQNIRTTSSTEKHRSCTATVLASNGAQVAVNYTIDEQGDNYQYYLKLGN